MIRIKGKIFTGLGQGVFFTQLDWVKKQCLDKIGFVPFPVTLDLTIEEECLDNEVNSRNYRGQWYHHPKNEEKIPCEG